MKNIVGVIVCLSVCAAVMGPVFWVLAAIGAIGWVVMKVVEANAEANLTDDERRERRRQDDERRHAKQMMLMQEQHQKKLQAEAAKKSLGALAAKTAFSVGIHMLTGGNHRHHHH